MTRDEVVDERVDVRQFGALADFKTRDGDVADSSAIDFNRRIRSATTDGELPMLGGPLCDSDDAQAGARNRDLMISRRRGVQDLLRPGVDRPRLWVAAVVEVDRTDFGAGERKPNAISLACQDGSYRGTARAPRRRVVIGGVPGGVVAAEGRLGPPLRSVATSTRASAASGTSALAPPAAPRGRRRRSEGVAL